MAHWDERYRTTEPRERSWSEDTPTTSLALIDALGLEPADPILDVGGGASRLVDALLQRRYLDVTVLDVAAAALEEARARVDDERVEWIVADVTAWSPPRAYRLWHDRATFHFLTDQAARQRYRATLRAATGPGSAVVLATFAPGGPATCSGLPVTRWSPEGLADEFGDEFTPLRAERVDHVTPWGARQPFSWLVARRR